MQTGAYTTLDNLDIVVKDTKNFTYTTDALNFIYATRANSPYDYKIELYFNNPSAGYTASKNVRRCRAFTNAKNKEICNSLGCENWPSDWCNLK